MPGSVMKVRRSGCGLNVWMLETGRNARRAFDMIDGKSGLY